MYYTYTWLKPTYNKIHILRYSFFYQLSISNSRSSKNITPIKLGTYLLVVMLTNIYCMYLLRGDRISRNGLSTTLYDNPIKTHLEQFEAIVELCQLIAMRVNVSNLLYILNFVRFSEIINSQKLKPNFPYKPTFKICLCVQ